MSLHRVLRKFSFLGCVQRPNWVVRIDDKITLNELSDAGYVSRVPVEMEGPAETRRRDVTQTPQLQLGDVMAGRQRVLVWLRLSRHYSGGRIHICQMAWCLAANGHDVTICSEDARPAWLDDYPARDNLHFLRGEPDHVPDWDVVICEGKHPTSRRALRLAHERAIPLIAWNFETPNWCAEHHQGLARDYAHHDQYRDVYAGADLVLCNSDLSARYFREWLDLGDQCPPVQVLPPAVNDHAIDEAQKLELPEPLRGRRYVVACGRGVPHKRWDLAWRVAREYPGQMDLVAIGTCTEHPGSTDPQHKIHRFDGVNDATKYRLMMDAEAVLAPSEFEGWGMVIAEARCVGAPGVGWKLPVTMDEHGPGSGWDFVPCDADDDEFVAKAHTIAQTPTAKLGKNSPLYRKRHGLEKMRFQLGHLQYCAGGEPHCFYVPWLNTRSQFGGIRITAIMNAWFCGPTVKAALASIYGHVHEIIIAYGREAIWEWPEDDTLQQIEAFPDPERKIRMVRAPFNLWHGAITTRDQAGEDSCRIAMRKACLRHATGNYLLILDGDEIWTGFEHYVKALRDGRIRGGAPLAVTPWHDLDHHILTPGRPARWGQPVREIGLDCRVQGAIWPHVRCVPWRYSNQWKTHVFPTDHTGRPLWSRDDNVATVRDLRDACVLYHLGHCLPRARMAAKKQFYAAVEGHTAQERAWLDWNGQCGPVPGEQGVVERIDWHVPDLVREVWNAAHDLAHSGSAGGARVRSVCGRADVAADAAGTTSDAKQGADGRGRPQEPQGPDARLRDGARALHGTGGAAHAVVDGAAPATEGR
jgi:glycosyltransferase involved in cell wall biosynthesis